MMQQLDEQMRESSELTSVLAGPLQDDGDFDMNEEFESLGADGEMVGSAAASENLKALDYTQNLVKYCTSGLKGAKSLYKRSKIDTKNT